ncbi:pyridoxamine 5'-phosphate oxidase family protein [Pedococcus sp. KACC 23699]|uniref:Pyridoxamine 5'-phosphate oxidase family protein n=1 Tax=Pedococcus sp. KACC 23699 TaxID=3149228 RepID=A0AAU7JSX5_9MICO
MDDSDTSRPGNPQADPRNGWDIGSVTDHSGLRVMGLEECLSRVDEAPVGRLAFPLDGEIAVLPVNHVLDGVDICFRTAGGSKIQAAVDGDAVSYEVDEWDSAQRSGWSVLVHGTATIVDDDAQAARLDAAAPPPWFALDPEQTRWVRVSTRQVTGRMIVPQ